MYYVISHINNTLWHEMWVVKKDMIYILLRSYNNYIGQGKSTYKKWVRDLKYSLNYLIRYIYNMTKLKQMVN